VWVNKDTEIIVCVRVNETRRKCTHFRVDFATPLAIDVTGRGNAPARNTHVPEPRLTTSTIHY
jgi:hypothetical protein